tara:strand:+ start:1708 stop:2085 length:378 start_codon:yes stop_codon:yes gene_type:complete
MAMVNCKACKEEISKEAKECPKCGQPNKQANSMTSIISVVFFIGFIWFLFGGGIEKQAAKDLGRIQDQVAADSVKQYNIAKRQGDAIQICVQAGMVTAAYLQANDESNYRNWKSIEKSDCANAGL